MRAGSVLTFRGSGFPRDVNEVLLEDDLHPILRYMALRQSLLLRHVASITAPRPPDTHALVAAHTRIPHFCEHAFMNAFQNTKRSGQVGGIVNL